MQWNPTLSVVEDATEVYHRLGALIGLPARLTVRSAAAGAVPVWLPGIVHRVVVTGILLDLEMPVFHVSPGDSAELEVIARDALIRCESTVTEVGTNRIVYMHLPEKIDVLQRRRHPRLDVELTAAATREQEEHALPVSIVNLSMGGVGFTTARSMAPGTFALLHLTALGMSPAEIPIRVVRCEGLGNGQWMVGVAFQLLNPAQEAKLTQYLATVLEN